MIPKPGLGGASLAGTREHEHALARLAQEQLDRGERDLAWRSLMQLGLARERLGDADGAAAAYDGVLALRADCTEALSQLVDIHVRGARWESAVELCNRTLAQFPEHVGAKYKKAFVLSLQGELDLAWQLMREVAASAPTYAPAYRNLGAIATWQDRLADAVREYRRALQLEPGNPDGEVGLAQALLAMRDFADGWHHYEARALGVHTLRRGGAIPPVWQGQRLRGTLLLQGEGGFGDVIQFVRLASLARARVGRIVMFLREHYPPLARLLATAPGIDEIATDRSAFGGAAAAVSVMSLPYVLGGVSLDEPVVPVPYLEADPDRREAWRARLQAEPGLRVGLVWAGDPRSNLLDHSIMDRRRSIPLSSLEPLLDVQGVAFHSLQKGSAARELARLDRSERIVDHADELADFSDTAALVSELDLVISVDTAVVHLAGALGKPVWLLNRRGGCWRWGITGDTAAWYPSMRIFRQHRFGEWPPVIARLADALQRFTAQQPRGRRS